MDSKKWSQSPVLPWTQRAYETHLSADSTAFELRKWSPHLELHPPLLRSYGRQAKLALLTEQMHR